MKIEPTTVPAASTCGELQVLVLDRLRNLLLFRGVLLLFRGDLLLFGGDLLLVRNDLLIDEIDLVCILFSFQISIFLFQEPYFFFKILNFALQTPDLFLEFIWAITVSETKFD